jgi:hypothetical protein
MIQVEPGSQPAQVHGPHMGPLWATLQAPDGLPLMGPFKFWPLCLPGAHASWPIWGPCELAHLGPMWDLHGLHIFYMGLPSWAHPRIPYILEYPPPPGSYGSLA